MSLPRTYKVFTLGCKLNQFDSASIEGLLRQRGFTDAHTASEAGVVVINTCTVTERADRDALRIARRARRERSDCRLILTGCYAERDRARLEALGFIDAVVGRTDRARIPGLLDEIARTLATGEPIAAQPPDGSLAPVTDPRNPSGILGRLGGSASERVVHAAEDSGEAEMATDAGAPEHSMGAGTSTLLAEDIGTVRTSGPTAETRAGVLTRIPPHEPHAPADIACIDAAQGLEVLYFGERTRAFLKIQEGCDLRCSYCIIPQVRGRSRSVPPADVAHWLEALIARGYREVVLTGVNSGDYGRDLATPTTLAALLRRLLETPGLGRLRLNSLEPRTVTPELVAIMGDHPRMARHLQVPLQSGCDRILRAMHRNYTTDDYLRTLATLREAAPDIGLGADVIVGFPGETDEDFETTVRFLERSPLSYLHVFSYSDRPGTRASEYGGHVPHGRAAERSARLRALGRSLDLRFRGTFLGRRVEALVFYERRPDQRFRGMSSNFIDLGIDASPGQVNTILPVRIDRVTDSDTLASIIH